MRLCFYQWQNSVMLNCKTVAVFNIGEFLAGRPYPVLFVDSTVHCYFLCVIRGTLIYIVKVIHIHESCFVIMYDMLALLVLSVYH